MADSGSFSSGTKRMQSVRTKPRSPLSQHSGPAHPGTHDIIRAVQEAFRATPITRHREPTYVAWIKEYLLFYGTKPVDRLDAAHVEAFLSHLAGQGHATLTHQVEALDALQFLHEEVFGHTLGTLDFKRAPAFRMPTERWYRAPQSVDTSLWDYS